MKSLMILENLSQLKALSEQLRVDILMRLIEKAYTGQQLSKLLDVPRSKVHYHLNELEKNALIEQDYTEEKNGIIQKFYRATAKGYIPSKRLLPHAELISNTGRSLLLEMSEATRRELLNAPDASFEKGSIDNQWSHLASIRDMNFTDEQFKQFINDYTALLNKYDTDKIPYRDSRNYYISTLGFKINKRK